MHTIHNWTAKRAGGRITVYGKDIGGAPTKLVGVDKIALDNGAVLAHHKNGEVYRLSLTEPVGF